MEAGSSAGHWNDDADLGDQAGDRKLPAVLGEPTEPGDACPRQLGEGGLHRGLSLRDESGENSTDEVYWLAAYVKGCIDMCRLSPTLGGCFSNWARM
mmetsp:Transcript_26472/g.69037  ORF Transcript_26472/g.69037 Transcript_26472/m.69037 type:complete len:97 (+) Transcript_26472:544-834(+)